MTAAPALSSHFKFWFINFLGFYMWCIAECVVCGRCGQELVSLEPHTCPPGHALPPAPLSLASITLQSDPVVSHNNILNTNSPIQSVLWPTNCGNTIRLLASPCL